jgi:hypothetical protein
MYIAGDENPTAGKAHITRVAILGEPLVHYVDRQQVAEDAAEALLADQRDDEFGMLLVEPDVPAPAPAPAPAPPQAP